MPSCVVLGCCSNMRRFKGKARTYHKFPFSKPDVVKKWIDVLERPGWTPKYNSRVCSVHFTSEMFDRTGQTVRLRENAVPILHLDHHTLRKQRGKDKTVVDSTVTSFRFCNTKKVKLRNESRSELCGNDEIGSFAVSSPSNSNGIFNDQLTASLDYDGCSDILTAEEIDKSQLMKELLNNTRDRGPATSSDIEDYIAEVFESEEVDQSQSVETLSSSAFENQQFAALHDPPALTNEHTYCRPDVSRQQQNAGLLLSSDDLFELQARMSAHIQASSVSDLRLTLHSYQKEGYLCDTVLIGEDGQVRAHGVVLAAGSNLLKSSLKSTSKPLEHIIVLPGVQLYLLEIVVHFAYTGEIAVPESCNSTYQMSKIINVLMELEFIVPTTQFSDQKLSSSPVTVIQGRNDEANSEVTVDVNAEKSCGDVQESVCAAANDIDNVSVQFNSVGTDGVVDDSWTKGQRIRIASVESMVVPQSDSVSVTSGSQSNDGSRKRQSTDAGDDVSDRLCEVCGEVFATGAAYRSHKKKHAAQPSIRAQCTKCSVTCSTMANLRRHMMQHTGERPHLCQHCGESFVQRQSMVDHVSSHHPDVIDTDPSIVARRCPDCGVTFYNSSRFRNHLITSCRSDTAKPRNKPKTASPRSAADDVARQHACRKCPKRFRLLASLIVHGRVHDSIKPRWRQTDAGRVVDGGATVGHACRTCGKQLNGRYSLILHERLHTGEKPFTCPLCGWKARSQTALFLHVLVHTGELPYVCAQCGQAFRIKASLRCHEQIHHNPPHNKAFYESTVVGHDGQVLYACTLCDKVFQSRAALLTHGRVHQSAAPGSSQSAASSVDKPFVCVVCNKRVRTNMHLKSHMRMHTGEKPFACQMCTKAYKSNTDLRLHYRSVHRLELKKRPGRRPVDEVGHQLASIDSLSTVGDGLHYHDELSNLIASC